MPPQATIENLVKFLVERQIIGAVIRGRAIVNGSVAWEPGPGAQAATQASAWEIILRTSADPEMYFDDSGPIAETRLALIFKEAADARDEFVREVSRLLGAGITDGISHH